MVNKLTIDLLVMARPEKALSLAREPYSLTGRPRMEATQSSKF